eukprot:COSAG06_NODE_31793_length_515_cov_1.711538_2_plen_34_part_01
MAMLLCCATLQTPGVRRFAMSGANRYDIYIYIYI